MSPLDSKIFITFFVSYLFVLVDGFALDYDPQKMWHSYIFNSGAGNREGVKFFNFQFSNFAFHSNVKKWRSLEDEYGTLILGIGKDFILLKSFQGENESLLERSDLEGNLLDFSVFKSWNYLSQRVESFAIIGGCKQNSLCFLNWYQIIGRTLVLLWEWPINQVMLYLDVIKLNYESKLLIVSNSGNDDEAASVEIYSFALDKKFELWLHDRFTLDEYPSSGSMIFFNDNIFLSFSFPKRDLVSIYRCQKLTESNHFNLYQEIHVRKLSSLIFFQSRFHLYLAIAGANSSIYKFSENFEFTSLDINVGKREHWFAVPLHTYREDFILFAEGEDDTSMVLWTDDQTFEVVENLADMVHSEDRRSMGDINKFSAVGATSFTFNKHQTIVYTSSSGQSKMLNFSIKMEPIMDEVQLELKEVSRMQSLLEERWKTQKVKIQKLKEAVSELPDEENRNLNMWKLKHIDAESVYFEADSQGHIGSFEFGQNPNWTEEDYSEYLKLLNDFPNVEKSIIKKINQIEEVSQDYKLSNTLIEHPFVGDSVIEDVQFLGDVTINNLELQQLNGVEVDDVLHNSFMMEGGRKIGGIKKLTNLQVDNIAFEQINNVQACDIVFSDDLTNDQQENVINGDLIYENSITVLNELDIVFKDGKSGLIPYSVIHGYVTESKISFDRLRITEETTIEETINELPLILPVHNGPFNESTLSNVNQARIEKITVDGDVYMKNINGIELSKLIEELKQNFTIPAENSKVMKFVTTNLDVEYLNGVKFPEGFNLRKSTVSYGRYHTGRFASEVVLSQGEPQEESIKYILDGIEIDGFLFAKNINGYTWESLKDLLKENEIDPEITGEKYFKNMRVSKNLNVKGTMNGIKVENIMNSQTEQFLNASQSFSDVVFKNIHVRGTWDGRDVSDLKGSIVCSTCHKNHEAKFLFEKENPPQFKNLVVTDFLNNKSMEEINGGVKQQLQLSELNELHATVVIINGNLISNKKINNVDLRELDSKRASLTRPQVIHGNLRARNLTVTGNLRVLKLEQKQNLQNLDVLELLTSESNFVNELVVLGNIETERGVNGFDLREIQKNAVYLTKSTAFLKKITFEDPVTFRNLKLNGRLQGFNLKRFDQDLVYNTSQISLQGSKRFLGNLTVLKSVKLRSLNGHLMQEIMTKNGDHFVKGPITINGDVVIRGNITVYGSINKLLMQNLIKSFSTKDDAFLVGSDIVLRATTVENLTVDGSIFNKSFTAFVDDVVYVDGDSSITARKVILGPATFEKNLTVEETLNGLNLTKFYQDLVFHDEKEIVIDGDVILNTAIIKNLEIQKDFNSTQISGIDINEWIEESIPLSGHAIITGKKTFESVHVSGGSIVADYINGHTASSVIPLNEDQIIPQFVYFPRFKSLSNIHVGNRVNKKVLMEEFLDTVFVDEDQTITGKITFENDLIVEGDVKVDYVNGKNLTNVITLYNNQTISSELIFEDAIIINGGFVNTNLINGIDIFEWSNATVTKSQNETVSGFWTVSGNVTFMKNVLGNGLLNGVSVPEVAKSMDKMKLLISDIEYRRKYYIDTFCEKISNFSRKLSRQPSIFHHFEISQALHSSADIEAVISFQVKEVDYLLLTFFNECWSVLYEWSNETSKYTNAIRINIGTVDKWITLTTEKAAYLITSSENGGLCDKNGMRGNVWVFESDRHKFGHLIMTSGFSDIIKGDDSSGTYYTLEDYGDVFECKIEPKYSRKLLIRLVGEKYTFVDPSLFGTLTFTNGKEIKNLENRVIYKFQKPFSGRIHTYKVKGKVLAAVAYHNEVVIYDNLFRKIYASIPTSNAGSMLWFSTAFKETMLILAARQRSIKIIGLKGISTSHRVISIPMACHKLFTVGIKRKHRIETQYLIVLQKKKILFLEAHIVGSLYQEPELDCSKFEI